MDDKDELKEKLRDEIINTTVNMTETVNNLKKIAIESDMEFSPDNEKEFNELLKEANDIVDELDKL